MDSSSDPRAKNFEFRGAAGEWFGIWIVNLLLSICTIGIYSAWAKVRRNKYFYNNTFVDGRNFDYHATGKQILIGRLIVVGAYVAFNIIAAVLPPLAIILVIAVLIALPWLIVRSVKFNARMSSFSNVRFDFHGKAGRAFVVYLLCPILAYVLVAALFGLGAYLLIEKGMIAVGAGLGVLGLLATFAAFPFIDRLIKQFSISNHSLGVSRFDMQAPLAPFLKAFAASMAWMVAVGLVGAAMTGFSIGRLEQIFTNAEADPAAFVGLMALLYGLFFAAFLPAGAIYQAMTRNVVYGSTELAEGHRFISDVSWPRLFWIILSNVIVVICTLGLMLPWAQVRMAKYLADHTMAVPNGSMDEFVGGILPEGSAIGDAYTDLEAIDIGLPI